MFPSHLLCHSIGSFVCPISSKWTQNPFIPTHTLDPNKRTTSWAAPTNATWVLNSVWRIQSGGVGLETRTTKTSVLLFFSHSPSTRILSLRGGVASAIEHACYPMVRWLDEPPTRQRVL